MGKKSLLWLLYPLYLLTLAAAIAAVPLVSMVSKLEQVYVLLISGLIGAVMAAVVTIFMARRLRNTAAEIETAARRLGEGGPAAKIVLSDITEFRRLGQTFNQMAQNLNEKIDALTAQRNELKAVLSSMIEGVVVIDSEERIVSVNNSAAAMLNIDMAKAQGQSMQAAIWNSEFQQLVAKVLRGLSPVEQEITVYTDSRHFIQVHGAALKRAGRCGAVMVCNDITRLKQLEDLRRQFVANVSHELKTPITSIKGFVETLMDGAINEPADARHFLEIIAKQSNRLTGIIDDLLSLSRIEQESDTRQIVLAQGSINEVIKNALAVCQAAAVAKKMNVAFSCEADISARINAELLEQAVINLVDNAIKYTEPGKNIEIVVEKTDERNIAIHVIDQGYGIAAEHLPRIFERFYVADKARTRMLGGTGLGLAIVKHIAAAHCGTVSVISEAGKGSTFSITIPSA